MNTEKAIKLLREMQEAWKLQITGDAFDAIEMAITALQQLDNNSTKPDNSTATQFNAIKTHVKGLTACRVPEDDYISRQEAIDVCMKYNGQGYVWSCIMGDLRKLPSVQPDIVHCKDCEYGEQDEVGRWFCRSFGCQIGNEDGSGYCADAERRTNE